MNQKTHYALSFYHLALAVRDTLEYVQNRPAYPLQVFNAKKASFEMALKDNSPFMGFCKNNGEIGEKIHEQLKDMYDTVYGEERTFISIEGENVVPDHAQNLKVLDFVLPLKQSLYNIVKAYIQEQKSSGEYEEGVEEIIELEDKFYRSIVSMILCDLLFNVHFVEFNKAMAESKGVETPQSNFCVNDIKKVIGMFNFVRQNISYEFPEYRATEAGMDFGIKLISAQEKVPEGSNFKAEFDKILQSWYSMVATIEPQWRERHQFIWGQLVEFEKNAMAQAQKEANKQ